MLAACFRAQAVWYDEGTELKDTRSGFVIKDELWKQRLPAVEWSTQLASMREATSAQADLTRLATNHPLWFRGSTKWGDAPALSGERS